MITDFKIFERSSALRDQVLEFYKGPHKAAGFKHYQELGFALSIQTTEQGMSDFNNIYKKFETYIKRLGSEVDIVVNNTTYKILLGFPAINEFEAFSIIEQIYKYLSNKKIPVVSAEMTPNTDTYDQQDQLKTQDITSYLRRKEMLKAANPKANTLADNAYKSRKIGF